MPAIYCFNNISKKGTDQLPAEYELTENLEEATGVLVRSAALHDTEFPAGLLAIARAGAGVNNIPLDRCAEEGIVVFNTPGANANAVKELVLCGMLLASRGIVDGVVWCRENADDENIAKSVEKAKKAFAGREILGKKLGVIGLGAIGAQVANTCRQLGMKVLGYDPYLSVNAAWSLDRHIHHVSKLSALLEPADYITLHVPVIPQTKGMIGAAEIAAMKDGVIIINYARDLLVDEEALYAALASGHVRRYVTDFANTTSVQMQNAIVTTHLGASTREAEENCAVMAANELMDYLENGNVNNSVNFGDVDLGRKGTGARICVFNRNVPKMIGRITSTISEAGLNIENMANKASGDVAYMLIELSEPSFDSALVDKLNAIDGIIRVRAIQ